MMVFMKNKRMAVAVIVPITMIVMRPGVMMIIGDGGESSSPGEQGSEGKQ